MSLATQAHIMYIKYMEDLKLFLLLSAMKAFFTLTVAVILGIKCFGYYMLQVKMKFRL